MSKIKFGQDEIDLILPTYLPLNQNFEMIQNSATSAELYVKSILDNLEVLKLAF